MLKASWGLAPLGRWQNIPGQIPPVVRTDMASALRGDNPEENETAFMTLIGDLVRVPWRGAGVDSWSVEHDGGKGRGGSRAESRSLFGFSEEEDDNYWACIFSTALKRNVILRPSQWQIGKRESKSEKEPPPEKRCREPSGALDPPSNGTVEVSFIMPFHNNVATTVDCLLSLIRNLHELPSAEVVIMDDGSSESLGALSSLLLFLRKAFAVRVQAFAMRKAVGYTQIMRQGIRRSNGR